MKHMKSFVRTGMLCMAACFSLHCAGMMQAWRMSHCNYSGAYEEGVNDAKANRSMEAVAFGYNCGPMNNDDIQKAYREGYASVTTPTRTTTTTTLTTISPTESSTNHSSSVSMSVGGFPAAVFTVQENQNTPQHIAQTTTTTTTTESQKTCLEAYGKKACGYHCIEAYGQVACASDPNDNCIEAYGKIKCGHNCQEKYGKIDCDEE